MLVLIVTFFFSSPQNNSILTSIMTNDADFIRWILKAPERHPDLVDFGADPPISVQVPDEFMTVGWCTVSGAY